MRRPLVIAAAALAGCGGGVPPKSPDAAVKAWAAAINDRDFEHACELSASGGSACESDLKADLGDDRLVYGGPASNGNPADRAFSLTAGRDTLTVTAVPRGGGYVVRFDAILEPFSGP